MRRLADDIGTWVAKARITSDAAGLRALLTLLAEASDSPARSRSKSRTDGWWPA